MIEKTNEDWVAMSDKAIIGAIGAYIRHQRLEQNKTQAPSRRRCWNKPLDLGSDRKWWVYNACYPDPDIKGA